MNDWSMLRKLIWLHVISGGGSSGARTTVTGVSPLALANALAKPIRSLIQYGKVTTSNGEMYCNNGKLVAVGDELSVVGTPEVLTVGEQTATVENLLAVDDIKDEQNIISGAVTRRCEAVVSDGTTPSGRYIGTVGDGNIIVKVRETGYEGDVATFEADRAKPLNGLTVNVEPIQDLHGYDSPWPAGGGKNLCRTNVQSTTIAGVTWTVDDDGSVTASGTATGYSALTLATLAIDSSVGVVTVSAYGIGSSSNVIWNNIQLFDASNNVLETLAVGASTVSHTIDLSQYPTLAKMVLAVKRGINGPVNALIQPQIEKGSTATAWTPYSNICPISGRTSATIYHSGADTSDPTTYTIQLGDTVYGGQLDVTQGKMVVDRAMVDMGTLSFFKTSSVSTSGGSLFSILVSSVGVGMAERVRNAPNTMISDVYKTSDSAVWWANQTPDFGMSVNTNSLFVADSRYSTFADFRAAVSGVQLCYELATPIEITLTPTQIETLIGTNNIWSDAGSVKAYVADGDVIEHVTAQPMRTVEGSNTVSVTSAVAPVQLSATYTASE